MPMNGSMFSVVLVAHKVQMTPTSSIGDANRR